MKFEKMDVVFYLPYFSVIGNEPELVTNPSYSPTEMWSEPIHQSSLDGSGLKTDFKLICTSFRKRD